MDKEGRNLPQKLVLVMPETDIVVEVYENLENLQIEEQDGEVAVFWNDGSVQGVRSELIVLNQDELPELNETVRERPVKAPSELRLRDKKAQFKKRTLADLDAELAALRQEVEALKRGNLERG